MHEIRLDEATVTRAQILEETLALRLSLQTPQAMGDIGRF